MVDRPFVGRDDEISHVRQHAERAAKGHTQLIVIEGPRGVGKSTLLQHALRPYRQWSKRWITLDTPDRDVPGGVIRQLVGAVPNGVSFEDDLDGLVEHALDVGSTVTDPSLVVIEDVHLADDASLHACWRGFRKLQNFPGLIVLTMRPNNYPEVLRIARLAQTSPEGTHLKLRPFGRAQTKQLLAAHAGHPIGDALAGRVLDATDGIADRVESIGRWLRRTPFGRDRSLELALEAFEAEHRETAVVQRRTIRRALNDLGSGSVTVVEVLTIAERPLGLTELTRVVGVDQIDVDGLLESGLVEWDERGCGYRIADPHVTEAMKTLITPLERAAHHLRLAPFAEPRQGLRHRSEAMRLDPESGDVVDLVKDLNAAAEDAFDSGDHPRAFGFFRDVCVFEPGVRAFANLMRAAMQGGQSHRLFEVEEAATRLPPGAGRTGMLARIDLLRGNHDRAFRALEAVRELPVDDASGVMLYAYAVVEAGRQSAVAGMFEMLERGVGVFERTAEALEPIESMMAAVASTFVDPREAQRAQEALARIAGVRAALDLWRTVDHDPARSIPQLPGMFTSLIERLELLPGSESAGLSVRMMRGARFRQIGAFSQAYADLRHAESGRRGDRDVVHARTELALTLFGAGLWEEANDAASLAVTDVLEVAEDGGALIAYAVYALVAVARGHKEPVEVLDRLDQVKAEYGPLVAAMLDWARAWAAISDDDHLTAAHHLKRIDHSRAGWMTLGMPPIAMLARALFHSGQAEVLAAVVERIDDPVVPSMEGARRYTASHVRGLHAWNEGDPVGAMDHFLVALEWLEQEPPLRPSVAAAPGGGMAIYRAVLALDAADLVTRYPESLTAHHQQVATLVSWATTVFNGCGATTLAGLAAKLRSALREPELPEREPLHEITMRSPQPASDAVTEDPPAFAQLTSRERQVALLVAGGSTNREVANQLVLSVRTVEYHVANALTKLGLSSRLELRRLLL